MPVGLNICIDVFLFVDLHIQCFRYYRLWWQDCRRWDYLFRSVLSIIHVAFNDLTLWHVRCWSQTVKDFIWGQYTVYYYVHICTPVSICMHLWQYVYMYSFVFMCDYIHKCTFLTFVLSLLSILILLISFSLCSASDKQVRFLMSQNLPQILDKDVNEKYDFPTSYEG